MLMKENKRKNLKTPSTLVRERERKDVKFL